MNRLQGELRKPSPIWWVAAFAGLAIFALDLGGHLTQPNIQTTGVWVFLDSKLAALIAAALWVWVWRVRLIGLLMFGWAISVLSGDLMNVYPDSRLIATFGLFLFWSGTGFFFFHLPFSYPTGRLERHWPTRLLLIGFVYIGGLITVIPWLLFQDGRGCEVCRPRATSYLFVGHSVSWLNDWNLFWLYWSWVALTPVFVWLIWRRFRTTSKGGRRTVWPFLTAFSLAFVVVVVWSVKGGFGTGSSLDPYISYADIATGWLMVLGAVSGVLVTRRARGVVGDLVVELGRARPGGVRDALARAVGDRTLELALWVPLKNSWVDEQGKEVELPTGHDRAVTLVGEKVAAIIHDPVLLDQPSLLEAAGSAARFALENERLQVALRAQLAELRESRARIVWAGDEERRRLERDLHDGAQQRLLGLGMALQLLAPHLSKDAGPLLAETEAELQQALAELRELARGIHPAVLTDQGLDAAVRTLAARAPLPVQVAACGERLPAPVETAAYFVVSEALANIARYAHASKASVRVDHSDGQARIEVRDDGVGGANPRNGSGLLGLADRIAALDGQLHVDSPVGAGTTITAEIPCAS
jgi:signal transduction histidine kinase